MKVTKKELESVIREVIEESLELIQEGKKLKKYDEEIKVPGGKIVGWKHDTNGNAVIVIETIKNGKARNKSSQLGGVMSGMNKGDFKNEKPTKKLIDAVKDAIKDGTLKL